MLPYLFSLLEGTKLESYRFGYPAEARTITRAGVTLFDKQEVKGWITFMAFGSNNPYMTIRYEIDEFKLDIISPLSLYVAGRYLPASQLWWLDRYSVDAGLYICETQPTPWIPFRHHYFVQMFIHDDSTLDTGTLLGGMFEIAHVIDEGKFVDSLQAVLGTVSMRRVLAEIGVRR